MVMLYFSGTGNSKHKGRNY